MAQVYEEQMNLIRGELGPGSTDLEEFEGLVPNFASLMPEEKRRRVVNKNFKTLRLTNAETKKNIRRFL